MVFDEEDWRPMSYPQAVAWMIHNRDTAWLATGKPSPRAIVIADMYKKPIETLRKDVKAAGKKSIVSRLFRRGS